VTERLLHTNPSRHNKCQSLPSDSTPCLYVCIYKYIVDVYVNTSLMYCGRSTCPHGSIPPHTVSKCQDRQVDTVLTDRWCILVCLSVCLSVCQSVCLSVRLCLSDRCPLVKTDKCPLVCLDRQSVSRLSICRLSVILSVSSAHLSVLSDRQWSTCLSCLSVVCLSVCLSVCPSVCLSVCVCVRVDKCLWHGPIPPQ